MILVTLGTHEQPMSRLVAPLEKIASRSVNGPFCIQHGPTPLPAGWRGWPALDRVQLAQLIHDADVVVTHGGPATIGQVRESGKVPIVVPRQLRYGEHVDDHQVRYSRLLAELREVILIEDEQQLPNAVRDHAMIASSFPDPTPTKVETAVSAFAELVRRLESQR